MCSATDRYGWAKYQLGILELNQKLKHAALDEKNCTLFKSVVPFFFFLNKYQTDASIVMYYVVIFVEPCFNCFMLLCIFVQQISGCIFRIVVKVPE